ncbi:hypothetical protein ACE5IU_10010, partial [Leptospira kirschneri]
MKLSKTLSYGSRLKLSKTLSYGSRLKLSKTLSYGSRLKLSKTLSYGSRLKLSKTLSIITLPTSQALVSNLNINPISTALIRPLKITSGPGGASDLRAKWPPNLAIQLK